jgi:hypothetical protein
LARKSQGYVALIADMVRSRDISPSRRRRLQADFATLVTGLNRDYKKAIAAKFVITLGDEFQGLLNSASLIPDLIWRLEREFPERRLRVGIGFGTLDTPIQKVAINIDGPTLRAARSAIETAKKTKSMGGVFCGFGDWDESLNGIAGLLSFHRLQWTEAQRSVADLLRQGMSQVQVARKLRIRPQVVSRQMLAAGWMPYAEAEKAWRMILHKQVDPLLA